MSFKVHMIASKPKVSTHFDRLWCDANNHWYHFNTPNKGWKVKVIKGMKFRTCPVCVRREKVLMHNKQASLPIQVRNLGFGIGYAFKINPTKQQVKASKGRKGINDPRVEYLFWLDTNVLISFKKRKPTFWERIAPKTGSPLIEVQK